MNAAAFGLILLVRKGEGFGEDVDSLRGLARKSPLSWPRPSSSSCLSLAGIPPRRDSWANISSFRRRGQGPDRPGPGRGPQFRHLPCSYYSSSAGPCSWRPAGETRLESSLPVSFVLDRLGPGSVLVLGILPALLSDFAGRAVLGF